MHAVQVWCRLHRVHRASETYPMEPPGLAAADGPSSMAPLSAS